MSFCLFPDPFLEELWIRQFPAVGDLGLHLGLASIKTQQRGDRVDHVREAQPRGHDIGRVKFDGAIPHTALGLANAGLDKVLDEGCYNAAR